MSNLLTAAVAAKALKSDKKEMKTESNPKTLKESVFSNPLTWAVIAGAGIYFVSRILKKKDSQTQIAEKDVKKLEQQGQKPTYIDTNYQQFADAIYQAGKANRTFTGLFLGADEDVFINTFKKMKNDLDITKLISAFGERRLAYSLKGGNLGAFMQDELDADTINIINTDLRSKKINYQF